MYRRLDALTIVAIAFFFFLCANLIYDHVSDGIGWSSAAVHQVLNGLPKNAKQASLANTGQARPEANSYVDSNGKTVYLPAAMPTGVAAGGTALGQAFIDLSAVPGDPNAWADPYPEYFVTQGLHGQAYGHNAVDISAGKGADIHAPINGAVTALFVDQYNNTNLIIDNLRYQVLMLHGNYSVHVGQIVKIGDIVGQEWNNGYTLDFNGNLCAGRDCGYHMHLNIFDKRLNSNIDPFTLLSPPK